MSQLTIKHTNIFKKNFDALNNNDYRFIINQGGSRSSKTYSITQLLIVWCLTNPGTQVSIVRKSFPALRGSVMRDFLEVMQELGLYDENNHNKTEKIYEFQNGSVIEFFSVDDEQKLRGRKRDILWANEANELNFEQYNQLNMRTTSKIIFDFNPSEAYHWIYDIIDRQNAIKIHSTYKDNPFLTKGQIDEIENLKNIDEGYYKIYALGEKAITKSTIYSNWDLNYNENIEFKEIIYGLDFGYTNQTALIKCGFYEEQCHIKELIYETNLTSKDLIEKMRLLNINKNQEIICDNARPEIIEDLKRAGYSAKPGNKSVVDGINSVKMHKLKIDPNSLNLIKEISNYKWRSDGDRVLDEPVKIWDHAVDALRYAIHYYKLKYQKTDISYYRIKY